MHFRSLTKQTHAQQRKEALKSETTQQMRYNNIFILFLYCILLPISGQKEDNIGFFSCSEYDRFREVWSARMNSNNRENVDRTKLVNRKRIIIFHKFLLLPWLPAGVSMNWPGTGGDPDDPRRPAGRLYLAEQGDFSEGSSTSLEEIDGAIVEAPGHSDERASLQYKWLRKWRSRRTLHMTELEAQAHPLGGRVDFLDTVSEKPLNRKLAFSNFGFWVSYIYIFIRKYEKSEKVRKFKELFEKNYIYIGENSYIVQRHNTPPPLIKRNRALAIRC